MDHRLAARAGVSLSNPCERTFVRQRSPASQWGAIQAVSGCAAEQLCSRAPSRRRQILDDAREIELRACLVGGRYSRDERLLRLHHFGTVELEQRIAAFHLIADFGGRVTRPGNGVITAVLVSSL